MKKIKAAIAAAVMIIISGCSASASGSEAVSVSESQPQESVTEETEQQEVYVPSDSDKIIAKWFTDDIFDSEAFEDMKNYQYYARTLGQDKDFLLDPEMWEVYYSDSININKDIDGKAIYLIRLDPYKLLELYAENNGCTVDELCGNLSIKKEQLYYNWGYDTASVDYMQCHKKDIVTYSEEEEKIFGKFNNEARDVVMSTHMLTVKDGAKYAEYSGQLSENLTLYRRDLLSAYTDGGCLYSEFSEEEKSPSVKINGIGIRCVIPLAMPNAYRSAMYSADADITVMINKSPYAYGCADEDKIDVIGIIEMLNRESERKKK